MQKDLINSLKICSDEDFRAISESAFGQKAVANTWGTKYNKVLPKPISGVIPAKPWKTE